MAAVEGVVSILGVAGAIWLWLRWRDPAPPVRDDPPSPSPAYAVPAELPYREGHNLDTVRFAYVDANGDRSDRRVVVHQLEGTCFQGLCLSRRATRTFRLDRVQGDITSESSGEVQEPWAWARGLAKSTPSPSTPPPQAAPVPHHAPAPAPVPVPEPVPEPMGEVLFTGFARAERDALEQLADAHHWRVRKSITKHLTVLVTGPRAGQVKQDQAREVGAQVMDRAAFERLL